jgi:ribulose-phosphate 3-epimerase
MTSHRIKLAPSILAADFARLGEQVAEVERAGADRIHIDVMDGHFVPNISIGPVVVEALRPITRLPLEAHLMITDPDRYLEAFVKAGADTILVHEEIGRHIAGTIRRIKGFGKRAGIVINPPTPVDVVEALVPLVDLVLVMTVHPGFGGQEFMAETLPKIEAVRRMIDRSNPRCELEVDGGIEVHTAPQALRAGANVFVAGSAIFRAPDGIAAAMKRLHEADGNGV